MRCRFAVIALLVLLSVFAEAQSSDQPVFTITVKYGDWIPNTVKAAFASYFGESPSQMAISQIGSQVNNGDQTTAQFQFSGLHKQADSASLKELVDSGDLNPLIIAFQSSPYNLKLISVNYTAEALVVPTFTMVLPTVDWSKTRCETVFYNFLNSTALVVMYVESTVVSGSRTTVSFQFAGSQKRANSATLSTLLSLYGASQVQAAFASYSITLDSIIETRSVTTVAPPPGGSGANWIAQNPEIIAGAAAALLIIIFAIILVVLHRRAKRQELLRETMEAMLGEQDANAADRPRAPSQHGAKAGKRPPGKAAGKKAPAGPTGPKRDALAPKQPAVPAEEAAAAETPAEEKQAAPAPAEAAVPAAQEEPAPSQDASAEEPAAATNDESAQE